MSLTDTLTPVKTAFHAWYAQFQVTDDAEQRQARMKSITALAKTATWEDIEALVRIAIGSKRSAPTTAASRIRDAFRSADENFPHSGNDRELQVLAAASLIQIMESGSTQSKTALAITAAQCDGARSIKLPMDLVARAEATLRRRAEVNRQRPSLTATFDALEELDFGAIQENVKAQPDWNGLIAAFGEIQTVLTDSFAERAKQELAVFEKVANHLKIKDEELDMLWWLTGQHSIDLDCDFAAIQGDSQPLVMAKEMADLTTVLPGPVSLKGLLSRAGLNDRTEIRLVGAIQAVTTDWAQGFLDESEYSPVTMPLHFGLQRRLENGGGEEWVGNWSSVTGIATGFATSPLKLGILFYRERLQARFK